MWRRAIFALIALSLTGCGGAQSGDGDESTSEGCDPACEAKIHFVGNVGIPADIDHFTYAMCAPDCVELDIPVPADSTMQSTGEDPAVEVTVALTNEDYYPDLQGVFAFEGTWTSTTVRLEEGDFVSVGITRPDQGNIAATLRTLKAEETTGTCGCPTIEMDI